ncbi:MAG: hypothetical protein ACI4V1_04290, partial [Eubacteriales bacterium]
MFKVQPLRSREIQAKLAAALGVAYYENTYAFFAIDLPDTDSPDANAEADAAVLGLCQFTFAPEGAVIRSIAAAPGKKEDEAMVILVRAVMNFC